MHVLYIYNMYNGKIHLYTEAAMESANVLGWGRTTEGQLGLGGIEETTVSEPRSLLSNP